MDSFFFPSSPLFTAQHGLNQSVDECELNQPAGYEPEADLLFLQPEMPSDQKHNQQQQQQVQHYQLHTQTQAPEVVPSFTMCQPQQRHSVQQTNFDWSRADAQVDDELPPQLDSAARCQSHGGSSDASHSSGESSGHSTPTFVGVSSPVQMQMQLAHPHPVHIINRPSTSLLEQFNCTITTSTTNQQVADRTIVKVKRERNSKKAVPKKESASLPAEQPRLVASPSNTSAASGYNSDSSAAHQSPAHSFHSLEYSSTVGADEHGENNEPAAGDDEETKKRKLARKAELARLSRKRKKTKLTDLEAEVRRLEEELARVKRGKVELSVAAVEPDVAAQQKMDQSINQMVNAVQSGLVARTAAAMAASGRSPSLTGSDSVTRGNPTALTPLIDDFMVQYNTQQTNCLKHLEGLQQHHMKPLRTFEFLSWMMKQNHENGSHSAWSSMLSNELNIPSNSREYRELEGFRTSVGSQHNFDSEIERSFAKLHSLFQKRATQYSKNLNRIRSIFNEQQFCQYIEWQQRWKNQQHMVEMRHESAAAQQQPLMPLSTMQLMNQLHMEQQQMMDVPIKLE